MAGGSPLAFREVTWGSGAEPALGGPGEPGSLRSDSGLSPAWGFRLFPRRPVDSCHRSAGAEAEASGGDPQSQSRDLLGLLHKRACCEFFPWRTHLDQRCLQRLAGEGAVSGQDCNNITVGTVQQLPHFLFYFFKSLLPLP